MAIPMTMGRSKGVSDSIIPTLMFWVAVDAANPDPPANDALREWDPGEFIEVLLM